MLPSKVRRTAICDLDNSTIIWYYINMKLSLKKIETLCGKRNMNTGEMLDCANVSRNAFYSLARKKSVVPRSVVRLADYLGVSVSDLLEETPTPAERIRNIILETERVLKKHNDADYDNVRHTLLLLDEKPIDRLRRAIRRGRSFNFR